MRRRVLFVVAVGSIGGGATAWPYTSGRADVAVGARACARALHSNLDLPLVFERNTGRYDRRVRFVSRLSGGAILFLADREAVLAIPTGKAAPAEGVQPWPATRSVSSALPAHRDAGPSYREVRMRYSGSKGASDVVGVAKRPGTVNYLIGRDARRWIKGVPTFAKVKLRDVYPGIDLVYYQRPGIPQRRLEYDFLVKPGADARRVRLSFEGTERVAVTPDGDLEIITKDGTVRWGRPIAYLADKGRRRPVKVSWAVASKTATFRVARHDASCTLVIDPSLDYSNFLGGGGSDACNAVALDANGAAYVTGYTRSADFPTSAGAHDGALNGTYDAFVTKLRADGSAALYSTYLGGSSDDIGNGIAVDAAGNAYVCGQTTSDGFPTTSGAYRRSRSGGTDAFVTKLSANGTSLTYSTYLGGYGYDGGFAVAVDAAGCAYVVGATDSTNFPAMLGVSPDRGWMDAFVTKVSVTGSTLTYSTFLSSYGDEYAWDVAVDSSGRAYVVGETDSMHFPTLYGYMTSDPDTGRRDGFVLRLNGDGHSLNYSTYLGGAGEDLVSGVAVDSSGCAYVTGHTWAANFPTTAGASDTRLDGSSAAFVTKLATNGQQLLYSTFVGGSGDDWGTSIAVDASGNAYVTGGTQSTNFPTTPDALSRSAGGGGDALVTVLRPSGASVAYSTYLGGAGEDYGASIARDTSGHIVVAGTTSSVAFPATPGAFDTTHGGTQDGFVAKLSGLVRSPTTLAVCDSVQSPGRTAELTATLTTAGGVSLAGQAVTFLVSGTPSGSAVTNALGTASLGYPIPSGAALGDRQVCVEFAGDGSYAPATGFGTLTVRSRYLVAGNVRRLGAGLPDVTVAANGPKSTTKTASPGAPIPEDTTGVRSWLSVGEDGTLTSVSVSVRITHPYVGNLEVSLTHPDGTTVLLHNRTGGGADNIDTTYPDLTTPAESLAALQGKPGRGVWVMKIRDLATSDVGLFDNWGVALSLTRSHAAVSDGMGSYALPDCWEGEYVLTPAKAGHTFSPADRSVTVGPDRTDEHFEAVGIGTTLSVADCSAPVYGSIALTATLRDAGGTPIASKTVHFAVEGTPVGAADTDASGTATLPYVVPPGLGLGAKAVHAEFVADATHDGANGAGTLTISKATTTLWTIDRSGTVTEVVALRAYDLTRTSDGALLPDQDVTFRVDGTPVGTGVTNAGGDCTLNWIITDGPATRTILAEFAGDAAHTRSSATATLTAQTWQTKMTGADREGQITAYRILKAWLWKMDNTPVVGKGVGFKLDGTLLGTDNTRSTGLAQIGYTIADAAGAGVRIITSEWSGDGGYLPSSCTNTLNVLKATPYIWVMPRSVPQGGVARLYAYFRRLADYQKQAGKTVTFRIDGTWVADVVTLSGAEAGVARYQHTTIEPPGAHTIRCEFAGDAWVDAGYGEANLTIY